MNKRDSVLTVIRPLLMMAALNLGLGLGIAQSQVASPPAGGSVAPTLPCKTMRCTTMVQRRAAAASSALRRASQGSAASATSGVAQRQSMSVRSMTVGSPAGALLTLDKLYFGTHPNYANSPLPAAVSRDSSGLITGTNPGTGLRKFMDALPTLPVAVPDTLTFPGSDYYEIGLQQYTQKMHMDLPATTLRGYVQLNKGTDPTSINPKSNTIIPPASPQYLGPMIIAQRDRPVRVKFTNQLAAGSGGDLFIPVDTTVMGAGMNMNNSQPYQQNRANIHLHGGNTPWISDGTPHQWTVPQGDTAAANQRGDSVQFVPDMFFDGSGTVVFVPACSATVTAACWPNAVPSGLTNDPGQGSMTFYYTNQQSARLMFYHDHSYGTTRLNVYAGEAGAYVLRDPIEAQLIADGVIPKTEFPLVIQDRTFVPANPAAAPVYSVPVLAPGSGYNPTTTTVAFVNSSSCTNLPTATPQIGDTSDGFGTVIHAAVVGISLTNGGSCSTPPDVTIVDTSMSGTGAVAFASLATLAQQDPTWIWGTGTADGFQGNGNGDLWFPHTYMTNQWPDNPDGSSMNPMGRWDYGMWFWPPMTISAPGVGGLVHGSVACATATNLNQTCPGFPTTLLPAVGGMGAGSVASLTPEAFMDTPVVNGMAYPTVTVPAGAVRFRILNASNDRSLNLSLFAADPSVTTLDSRKNTEVKMMPAASTSGWPIYWPIDGRDGGVPDPTTAGPSWIQIGNEAGFIPYPVVIPPTPVGYEYARRSITVTNVSYKSLFLGAAERADVIVDFSAFAGQTLILYNDAPAPTPAYDPRYDYYTGDPDMTGMGGAPTTLAGFGPNTRTVMQIVVAGSGTPANLVGLQAQLPGAFSVSQPVPLIPEAVYGPVYGQSYPNTFLRLQDYSTTFTPIGAKVPVQFLLLDKTIQELFELDYGRMNATLGTELPLTNYSTQTTIPLGYVDPPTELLTDSRSVQSQPVGVTGDGTQIWKITHNGVDTHSVHFHLFNVQLINRIGWDGTNRPPDPNELGWKETIRMNPLEIEFVALRPMSQNLPWPIPDSVRLMDVTMPADKFDPAMTLLNALGTNADQKNHWANFGWEYVWHCHLLGHEENDMMRPMVLQVPPEVPANLLANALTKPGTVTLTWTDKSASETGFNVQRDTKPDFTTNPATYLRATASATQNGVGQGTDWGSTITRSDTLTAGTTAYYRVQAVNTSAYKSPGLTTTLSSGWSNVVTVGSTPTLVIAPSTLTFETVIVGSSSAQQTVTISNASTALGTLVVGAMAITGMNPGDFTQKNTCGSPITQGASCTITVTFTPAGWNMREASISFTTNDPLNMQPSISLTGTGSGPALTLAPTALVFPMQPVGTPSTPLTVTVTNPGTASLGLGIIAITGANAADFILSTNNCSSTLANGASCTITVSFKPGAAGARSALLTVPATTPATSQSVTLSGIGGTPGVTLTPSSLAFGNQLLGNLMPGRVVTLSNTGSAPLAVSSIAITGTDSGDFAQTTTCGAAIAPPPSNTSSCTITVAFKPLTRGSKSATLVITDNASGGFQNVLLTATGIAPVASVLPAPLLFAVQVVATTSASQLMILTNSGDSPLLISSILIGGANASEFVLVANSCLASLPAGQSCTLSVAFAPTVAGARTASLIVTSSDPVNPTLAIPITGTGTELALSPSALTFGTQTVGTSSASRTVTLTYVGTSTLTINSIALAGTTPTDFTMNNQCGTALRPGRSCTVGLRFGPTVTGPTSASLVVSTTDPGVPLASVALTGTGLAPALASSPATLTFISSLNTQTLAQVITVSNAGTAPLTINGVVLGGTDIGQFSENNNCQMGTSLAVAATCTINVSFRPTTGTPTTKSQTLSINVAAPATSQTIPLTGTVTVPTYSVSPAALAFVNQTIGTTSPSQTLTLTNTGTVSLPLTNVSVGGAGANRFAQTSNCGSTVFRPFPATLAVGASCNVNVTFSPRNATTSGASLNVSVGGGAAPAQTQVPLSGTGQ